MKVEDLAGFLVESCDSEGLEHMVTGSFATSVYGIPRATKDVDIVVNLLSGAGFDRLVSTLESQVQFDPQIQFDTLTWGRRLVGVSRTPPSCKIEIFELFDDPFVQAQFARRVRQFSAQIGRDTWIPTAEDVIVQKLRWGRSKDLDDARDVLAVQGTETLDMGYIERWCATHGTTERLRKALSEIPPL